MELVGKTSRAGFCTETAPLHDAPEPPTSLARNRTLWTTFPKNICLAQFTTEKGFHERDYCIEHLNIGMDH